MRAVTAVVIFGLILALPVFADPAHLIVPGQGIGSIELGGSIQRAITMLGQPKSTTTTTMDGGPARAYRWYETDTGGTPAPDASGFAVTAMPDGKIEEVSVRNLPAYETAEHLRTSGPNGVKGSTMFDVRRRMGTPLTVTVGGGGARQLSYAAGIRFWIDVRSQRVVQIDVF